MRLVLGLDAPTSGTVTVAGRRYAELAAPLRMVGSLLDAKGVNGGRTARAHLTGLAASNRLPRHRVADVLDLTGLTEVAGQRIRGFSLGMAQRLGIAAALLGDPEVLILDEPVNGLDAEGIRWIRTLLKSLAAQGRTVFLSSHLMSEMELTADHLVVIGRGRLLADTTVRDFIEAGSRAHTHVRSPEQEKLRALLEAKGATVRLDACGGWRVDGLDAPTIADLARAHDLAVHVLTPVRSSLEEVYTALSRDAAEYRSRQEALR